MKLINDLLIAACVIAVFVLICELAAANPCSQWSSVPEQCNSDRVMPE